MPNNYTGNAAAITARQDVVIAEPSDGDDFIASLFRVPYEYLANVGQYLSKKAGLIDVASTWTARQVFGAGLDANDDINLATTKKLQYASAVTRYQWLPAVDLRPVAVGSSSAPPSTVLATADGSGTTYVTADTSTARRFVGRCKLPEGAIITAVSLWAGSFLTSACNLRLAHVAYNAGTPTRTQLIGTPAFSIASNIGGGYPPGSLPFVAGPTVDNAVAAPADGFTELFLDLPTKAGGSDLVVAGIRVAYTHTLLGAPQR